MLASTVDVFEKSERKFLTTLTAQTKTPHALVRVRCSQIFARADELLVVRATGIVVAVSSIRALQVRLRLA